VSETQPRTFYVDPDAPPGGAGTEQSPYSHWLLADLQPGDTLLLRGGAVFDGLLVGAQGTADAPITIASYGGGMARIEGSVFLDGAAHVTVQGLDISGGASFGVVVKGGSTAVTVSGCEIHDGLGGVLVDGTAGLAVTITGNAIHDHDFVGVSFDGAVAAAGQEHVVSGNDIWRNGHQGILLHGSWVVVDGNTVVNNGLAGLPGMSAIHVLGGWADDPAGKHNTITDNVVAWQRDGSSVDGNGIMLDHWSGETLVSGNHVFGNDGAGISVLSSYGNTITGNIVHDNMVDAGGTHVVAYGELFVGESPLAPGLTTGNTISGNSFVSGAAYGVAVQVAAEVTGEASNSITGNHLAQTGAGDLWAWGTQAGGDLAGWNALPRTGSDLGPPGVLPEGVAFAPAWLDQTLTLHSALMLPGGGTPMMVAYGADKDVAGGAAGSWIAGDGRDNVLAATGGTNLISAGSGDAVLLGGPGGDSLFGGSGDVLMVAGSGDTLMIGGSGDSRLFGGAGADILFAGNGTGSKLLDGGGGQDFLVGGDGADVFVLGDGTDLIMGFTQGQDRIDLHRLGLSGFGDLVLVGDETAGLILVAGEVVALVSGIDVRTLTVDDFIFEAPAAVVTVSLEPGSAVLAEAPGGKVVSFTVTRSGDLSRSDVVAWEVAGSGVNPAGAADFAGGVMPGGRLAFVAGEASRTFSVTIADDGAQEGDESFTVSLAALYADMALGTAAAEVAIAGDGMPHCFAPGTRIATPFGARAVETLRVGDAVLTEEGAARRLAWVGRWATDPGDAAQRAVRVRAGAFGPGMPGRDLVVSPGHGLWFAGALVPAVALVDGVRVLREAAPEMYFHFACARHEVVLAEGLAVETFVVPEADSLHVGIPAVAGELPRLVGGPEVEALRAELGLAPAEGGPRQGFLEWVNATAEGIVVEGWAIDPQGPARLVVEAEATSVEVVANRWRIDLDRAGLVPVAGFRAVLPAWAGAVAGVRRLDGGVLARAG